MPQACRQRGSALVSSLCVCSFGFERSRCVLSSLYGRYAVGPLAGDNFIRFNLGACYAAAAAIAAGLASEA